MKPFKYTTVAAKLIGPYPLPDDVHALVHERIEIQSDSFVRLWLSEGIPYAFQSCPILYQVSREWIANRVGVSPNEIGIVGSAKLGYSLRPTPDFRKLFHPKSDLDYVIVSGALFEKCAEISLRFVEDYESGAISPRTEGQKRCWSEDVEFIKRNIPNGFVNSGKVPNFEKYEGLRRIEQDCPPGGISLGNAAVRGGRSV